MKKIGIERLCFVQTSSHNGVQKLISFSHSFIYLFLFKVIKFFLFITTVVTSYNIELKKQSQDFSDFSWTYNFLINMYICPLFSVHFKQHSLTCYNYCYFLVGDTCAEATSGKHVMGKITTKHLACKQH